jgi:glycine oxidase
MLLLVRDEAGEAAARTLEDWKRANGRPVERLSRAEALDRQPGLAADVREALLIPDVAQVRNHRMARALAEAAAKLGAEIRPQSPATGFLRVPGRVNGVKTPRGDVYAETTVLAAGAWSPELVGPLGLQLAIRPVKGQMLLLQAAPDFCRHMLLEGDLYLVPRADGKILAGSTLEDAGFDKTVTLEGVRGIAARVAAFLPSVEKLPLAGSWAGIRPATPDRLPYLGKGPMEGLLVAAGHFRNGILLAPVTAEIVADLVAGRPTSIDLSPFSPVRRAIG